MLGSSAEGAAILAKTYRVATAIFPEGNLIMRIREAVRPLFQTDDCAARFPRLGQPALDPAGLALPRGGTVRENSPHFRRSRALSSLQAGMAE